MAARIARLLVALALILGAALTSPAEAAVVCPPTSQAIATSPRPACRAAPLNPRSYFGARYYRADLGRFTTIDPVTTLDENLVDPQRWNRYSYVRNNPLKYTDPSGEAIETLWDIANVVMGIKSARDNIRAGRYVAAAVDVGGALLDGVAVLAPAVPGGVGAVIKTARAVERVDDAVDATRVARGVGSDPVIIGETMARVENAAAKYPGAKILNDMPDFNQMGMTREQVTSAMMQHNRKWILEQMRSGRQIIDIGPDINRSTPSIFYQMEQQMLRNYKKLHPSFAGAIRK